MAEVIVDTNFVLNCIRNKVDFYEELFTRGYSIIVPYEVKEEIKRLMKSKKALKFKEEAYLSLKLIDAIPHKEVRIGGKYVDKGLIDYCNKNPNVILATMDKELKKSVKNRKMVIRNKKKFELQ